MCPLYSIEYNFEVLELDRTIHFQQFHVFGGFAMLLADGDGQISVARLINANIIKKPFDKLIFFPACNKSIKQQHNNEVYFIRIAIHMVYK